MQDVCTLHANQAGRLGLTAAACCSSIMLVSGCSILHASCCSFCSSTMLACCSIRSPQRPPREQPHLNCEQSGNTPSKRSCSPSLSQLRLVLTFASPPLAKPWRQGTAGRSQPLAQMPALAPWS